MSLLERAYAAMYDRITASVERGWLGAARRELLGDLTGQVLEIGAGTGANFRYYPSQVKVTATEPSIHFFRRARRKLATAQAIIELQQADAQALPFDDDTFDAVVGTLVFCTIPDPLKALAELRRVTKGGAPLRLIEHVQARTPGKRLLLDLWNPCQKIIAGGCNVNWDTEATVRAAGFQVVEVQRLAVQFGLADTIAIRATN